MLTTTTKDRETTPGSGLGSVRPGANAPAPASEPIAPEPAKTPVSVRSTVGGVRTAIVWTGVGFIAGAVFWHAVGFWSFLSGVVLQGTREAHAEFARAESGTAAMPADRVNPPLPTIYLVDPANCTALALDRGTNHTVVQPCPSKGLALRLEPEGGRENLAGLASSTLQAARYNAD